MILIRFLAKQSHNNIDNPIDNGWISILQQIEIQSFNFLYLCQLIDKASLGLDKMIFAFGFVLLLHCAIGEKPDARSRTKQLIR